MTLEQLHTVKQWHHTHRRNHTVEFHVWDLVLTLWLLGWIGIPASLLLGHPVLALSTALLLTIPQLYVALRRHLHRRHLLRCDWIDAAG